MDCPVCKNAMITMELTDSTLRPFDSTQGRQSSPLADSTLRPFDSTQGRQSSGQASSPLAEVEIDYCTGCDGIWLDAGELEALLGDGGKSRALISSFNKSLEADEKKRKCPICDKKMEKIIVGKDKPALMLDRCVKGEGLWFDKGELNNIIARAELDEGNKIKQLLADMFGAPPNKTR
jgi:Zn-finger nucleic acid-binding protein